MIIFETIGLFIAALVGIVGLALLWAAIIDGTTDLDETSILFGFICAIVFLLLITSILFVQFRHYPEKFGYTAIEEVEEVEASE